LYEYRFRVIASYLSKVTHFNLLHLHLVPPLGWHHWNFTKIWHQKLEHLGYQVVLFSWS